MEPPPVLLSESIGAVVQLLAQIEGNALGPLGFDDVAILRVDEILPAKYVLLGSARG